MNIQSLRLKHGVTVFSEEMRIVQCVLAANHVINGNVSAEETWRGEGEAEAPPPGCPTCDSGRF